MVPGSPWRRNYGNRSRNGRTVVKTVQKMKFGSYVHSRLLEFYFQTWSRAFFTLISGSKRCREDLKTDLNSWWLGLQLLLISCSRTMRNKNFPKLTQPIFAIMEWLYLLYQLSFLAETLRNEPDFCAGQVLYYDKNAFINSQSINQQMKI